MARRKSFTSYNAEQGEPIEIELNGKVFHCQPTLPGQILLDFVGMADFDEDGQPKNPAVLAKAVDTLIKTAIVPEEHVEWDTFVRDPAQQVSVETLAEIAGYLAEEYTGRPLEQQPQSWAGAVPTGPLLTERPSSMG